MSDLLASRTDAQQLELVRTRHVGLMAQTLAILQHLLTDVDQRLATSVQDPSDGANGWTVLEVLCHLRDFDGFFRTRAAMMVQDATPALPAYDHEALAIARRYNSQSLDTVLQELAASRAETVAFFRSLTEDQWQCDGIHPHRGLFTMTDAVMQVGLHDCVHLEQISRILASVK